jgi:large subunit ribosomal protein L30
MRQARQSGPSLVVRQVRSGIGYSQRQKNTLRAMGLGRVGRRRRLPDNPQVRGMIAAVVHLVAIEGDAGGPEVEAGGGAGERRRKARNA